MAECLSCICQSTTTLTQTRSHYTPMQAGFIEDIKILDKKLIYRPAKHKYTQVHMNILAQEIGYNMHQKEWRTLLIERPLVEPSQRPLLLTILAPLSPAALTRPVFKFRASQSFRTHEDCHRYLAYISNTATNRLEVDAKKLRSTYMILSQYIEDACDKIRNLVETHAAVFVRIVERKGYTVCDTALKAINLAVETYVVHLMHTKLFASLKSSHLAEERFLCTSYEHIVDTKADICQLGAQSAFESFDPSDALIGELRRMTTLQSPLAVTQSLMTCMRHLTECLNSCVRRCLDIHCALQDASDKAVTICSDDLIASLIYSLAHAKPSNLYTIARYIMLFGWNSNAKDQPAYYSATLQIVVQYLTSDDLARERSSTISDDASATMTRHSYTDTSTYYDNSASSQTSTPNMNHARRFIESLDSRDSMLTESSDTSSDAAVSVASATIR